MQIQQPASNKQTELNWLNTRYIVSQFFDCLNIKQCPILLYGYGYVIINVKIGQKTKEKNNIA